LSELEQLEHQLSRAIQKQEFERAAHLRDRIRELRQQQTVGKE
jgi:protein-arginine kinase activator protein McsA